MYQTPLPPEVESPPTPADSDGACGARRWVYNHTVGHVQGTLPYVQSPIPLNIVGIINLIINVHAHQVPMPWPSTNPEAEVGRGCSGAGNGAAASKWSPTSHG